MREAALFNKSLGYPEAAHRCNLFHFESEKLRWPLRAENAPGLFDFLSFFLLCWNNKCKSPFSEKAECSKLSSDAQKSEGTSPKRSLACWDHEQLFSPRFLCILELRNRRAWLDGEKTYDRRAELERS